jgi:hypothetical protein
VLPCYLCPFVFCYQVLGGNLFGNLFEIKKVTVLPKRLIFFTFPLSLISTRL